MNERIRELAEQVGIAVFGDAVYMFNPEDTLDSTVIEKFANLVAAAEREACAEWLRDNYQDYKNIADICEAIRARGGK
jgi:hypothetical protein